MQNHRKYAAAGDVGSSSGRGIVSVMAGNTVELYVKCESDSTDLVIESISLVIVRLK